MSDEIINKVAQSGLITIDLEDLYQKGERIVYDMSVNLFQGLVLREKDFRAFLKEHDWSMYQDKYVSIVCSADAIVPSWAYMLLITKIQPYARKVIVGSPEAMEKILYAEQLGKIRPEEYQDAKVVVKGCGDLPVPLFAYGEIVRLLLPFVSSIMYGEPCSTVPVYKKPRQ